MTRPDRRTFLAPLLAVLAILLGISGSASGAFNHAATEVHYGDFLLWEAKALEVPAIEIADPTRGNGVWVYDTASGVPIYVRQNPWTFFDPLGLKIEEEGRVDEKPVDHPGRENDFRDNRNYDNLESAEKKAVRDEYDGLVMTAKDNAKFNDDHKRAIQGWKNYDLAIERLRSNPEGRELLGVFHAGDHVGLGNLGGVRNPNAPKQWGNHERRAVRFQNLISHRNGGTGPQMEYGKKGDGPLVRAKACSYMIGIEGQKVSQKQIDEFVSLIRGRMPKARREDGKELLRFDEVLFQDVPWDDEEKLEVLLLYIQAYVGFCRENPVVGLGEYRQNFEREYLLPFLELAFAKTPLGGEVELYIFQLLLGFEGLNNVNDLVSRYFHRVKKMSPQRFIELLNSAYVDYSDNSLVILEVFLIPRIVDYREELIRRLQVELVDDINAKKTLEHCTSALDIFIKNYEEK